MANKFKYDEITVDEEKLEEIVNELKNDALLVASLKEKDIPLELIDANLAYFIDYANTLHNCPCKDKDNCVLTNKYTPTDLTFENGSLQRKMGLCPLLMKNAAFKNRYLKSDFPEDWLDIRLEDINVTEKRAEYLKALINLKNGSKEWLYVYGPDGRGKLFMALSLINSLLEENQDLKAAVINYPQFIIEKTSDYFANKASIDKELSELSEVDFLILRDFGNEEINSLVVESITLPLVQQISRNGGVVIFLGNLSLDRLKMVYKTKPKSKIRNEQLLSYIEDNIDKPIHLTGTRY
ncbi:MAG: hypothetical protein ACOX28_01045 [Bacilli bacterium]|jgi:DNA replication protein DnaC